jgi:hypothetical protein
VTEKPPQSTRSASPETWDAFWRFYVLEHREPRTRRLHFAGTFLALVCLVVAALWANVWLALAAPVIAYGFAWGAHFTVERNAPATFRHPLRSLMADALMFGLMCIGRMDDEVARMAGEADPIEPRITP